MATPKTPESKQAPVRDTAADRDEESLRRAEAATTDDSSSASAGDAQTDQRLPENSQQDVGAASLTENSDALTGALSPAPPPAPPSPPEIEPAILVAVTVVKLQGKYFSPGSELPEDRLDWLGEDAVAELLAAGAIRED